MGIFIVGISYTRNPQHKPGDDDTDLYTSTHVSYDDAWKWAAQVRANPEPGVTLLAYEVATPKENGVWLATVTPQWFTDGLTEPPTPPTGADTAEGEPDARPADEAARAE